MTDRPETERWLTYDEVIAENVRRLREERGWSVATLAKWLDRPKHVVYDMERPRKGQPQRAFTWVDLVELCDVFETNLFELVLPIGDVRVDAHTYIGEMTGPVGRDQLGLLLFGVPGNSVSPEALKKLAQNLQTGIEERVQRLEELLVMMLEQTQEE